VGPPKLVSYERQDTGKGNYNIQYFISKDEKPIYRNFFFQTYKQVPGVCEWRDVVSCF